MKLYYFNPKTQDLHIFDPTSKEMMVLERIEGIRVLTSSEVDRPVDDDGKRTRPRGPKSETEQLAPSRKRASRTAHCKNCGQDGHFAKTCKNSEQTAPVATAPI